MWVLGVTAIVMVATVVVVWPLFRFWSALQLAPRVRPQTIREKTHRHPRLAAALSARFDPTALTGLALTTGAAVVLIGGVGFGLIVVMVRNSFGISHFDLGATRFAARHASSASTTVLRRFTQLGGAVVLVPMAVLVWLLTGRRHGWVATFGFLTLVVGGQFALADLIKWIVDRARPNVDRLTGFSGPSFPSGHATASAACLAGFAMLIGVGRSPRVQAALASAAVGLAAGIACSRVFLGVHWVTDVVGGLSLGWAWFALCSIAYGGRLLHFGAPAETAEAVAEQASPRSERHIVGERR
jgi:membrane-associated phospholipid phosphatase